MLMLITVIYLENLLMCIISVADYITVRFSYRAPTNLEPQSHICLNPALNNTYRSLILLTNEGIMHFGGDVNRLHCARGNQAAARGGPPNWWCDDQCQWISSKKGTFLTFCIVQEDHNHCHCPYGICALYTVQSYLELASSSPKATVENILCNEHFKSLRHFVSSMYCVPATSAPVERIFSHGGIFMRPHSTGNAWLMMCCVTWCLRNAMLLCRHIGIS